MTEIKDRKRYSYILEILYQRVFNRAIGGVSAQGLDVDTTTFAFTDDEKQKAYNKARKEMDRIIKSGMLLTGGSIVVSRILPSAIKQIGIIDLDQFEKEQELMAQSNDSINESQDGSAMASEGNESAAAG